MAINYSYDYEKNWLYIDYNDKRYAYTNISPYHYEKRVQKFKKLKPAARFSQIIKYMKGREKAGTSKVLKLDKFRNVVYTDVAPQDEIDKLIDEILKMTAPDGKKRNRG